MNASKTSAPVPKEKSSGFIWFIIIAFGLMLAIWLTLFILAAEHPVKEIPMTNGATTGQIHAPARGLSGTGCQPVWIAWHGFSAHVADSSAV